METGIIRQQSIEVENKPNCSSLPLKLKSQGEVIRRRTSGGISEKVAAYKAKHPDIMDWCAGFGKEATEELSDKDIPLGAISNLSSDECPCYEWAYACYGNHALLWMAAHIASMALHTVGKRLPSAEQYITTAWDILKAHGDLNLGELCVFIGRAKQGRYGHFYGAVDTMTLMEWMREFRRERVKEIAQYEEAVENERKAREKEEAKKNAITLDEYLAQCKAKGVDSSLSPDVMAKMGKGSLFRKIPERDEAEAEKARTEPLSMEKARDYLKDVDVEFVAKRDAMLRMYDEYLKPTADADGTVARER